MRPEPDQNEPMILCSACGHDAGDHRDTGCQFVGGNRDICPCDITRPRERRFL